MSLFRQEVLDRRSERLHGQVVLAQPLSSRLMTLLLMAILGGAAFWLVEGTYARTETARGILVTDIPSAKIMAPTQGVVLTLYVNEGTLVAKGDRLGIIDADRRNEGGLQVGKGGVEALDRRLALSRDMLALTAVHQTDERDRLQSIVRSASEKVASVDSQISIQNDIVASNEKLFHQLDPVVAKGFVSKVQYESKRQMWLNSRQQLNELHGQRLTLKGEEAAAIAQLRDLPIATAQSMNAINSSARTLDQQKGELKGAGTYSIVAPVAGRVTALQVNRGGAARVDIPMMIIVPDRSTLRAEVYAPSRAIGFIRPKQEVRLLYDAFPYQRFGSFPGRVVSISRIVIDPHDLQVPFKVDEPVYRITVALNRQQVDAYGERAALQPGMLLTGNIVLERQSFLSWILTPLRAILRRN